MQAACRVIAVSQTGSGHLRRSPPPSSPFYTPSARPRKSCRLEIQNNSKHHLGGILAHIAAQEVF